MKTLLLFSGGKESVFALHKATISQMLYFNYGQASYKSELASLKYYSKRFGVPYDVHKVTLFSPLAITEGLPGDNHVVFRNGVFMSIAVNYALNRGFDALSLGVTKTGGDGDDSDRFLSRFKDLLRTVYPNKLKIISPTANYTPHRMRELIMEPGVDYSRVWSCDRSGKRHCGECSKCQAFLKEDKVLEEKYRTPAYNKYRKRFYGLQ